MGYVRYKISEDTHRMLRSVCKNLGVRESELSRIALMEYLRSLGVFSDRVKHFNFRKLGK